MNAPSRQSAPSTQSYHCHDNLLSFSLIAPAWFNRVLWWGLVLHNAHMLSTRLDSAETVTATCIVVRDDRFADDVTCHPRRPMATHRPNHINILSREHRCHVLSSLNEKHLGLSHPYLRTSIVLGLEVAFGSLRIQVLQVEKGRPRGREIRCTSQI